MKMKSNSPVEMQAEEEGKLNDIMPIFWDLASVDEEKRIKSAADLIIILREKVEGLEGDFTKERVPDELSYTLRRLVKGSGSSRSGARQGFGTALAEILKNFGAVKFSMIHELINEHLSVKGSFEAQEERDALFGQAFCHAALIHALSHDMENYEDFVKKTAQELLTLMKKKSYLLELCTKLIVDLMEMINKNCFVKILFPILKDDLEGGWDNCTPEKFCIVLTIERLFKEVVGHSYFVNHWKCSKIFEKGNMERIVKPLMESTINSHPRMHFVWDGIFPHILRSSKVLKAFWQIVVEDGLLQSTHERKFLAFKVFQEMLAKVTKSQVEVIISDRLMRSIINSCSSEKNYLYSASRNLLGSIASQVAKNGNEGVAFAAIIHIIQRSGTISFDVLTKTKTIESLIGKLDPSSVANFITWLKKVFSEGKIEHVGNDSESEVKEAIPQHRRWAASQLLIVVRSVNLQKEEAWLLDIAKFLFFNGHFHTIKKKSKAELYCKHDPTLDGSTTSLCKERFLGTLAELSTIHRPLDECANSRSALPSIPGTLKSGEYYAYELVSFAQTLLQDSKYVALNTEWTPEAKEVFLEALGFVKKIREEVPRESPMSEDRAFELLFLHSCLQMFDKADEAADVIQELIQCYQKLKEKKKKKKTDEEPHWSEVLTEILLSFLTQSSHMMRQIVNMVFTIILPHLTHNAFQLITEALRPKKTAEDGDLQIVYDSDEDMGGAEIKSGDDADEEDDGENGHENTSSEESENESENGGEIDEAFRTEVKLALGDAALVSDEDISDDEKEDSDVDMDTVDPRVLDLMDKALAAAFNMRVMARSGRKKKEEEKRTIVHFRLRVLDIAELIVKKQPKSPFVLDLIEPLLEVIKVSSMHREESELHDRAQGVLNNRICHSREIPNGEDIDKEKLHNKIENLMNLAKNASSVQMVNLITQVCMYLIRVLRGKNEAKEPSPLKTRKQRQKESGCDKKETETWGCLNCERIVAIYQSALQDFMTRRSSHLQPIVFLEFIKRYPAIAWQLASYLVVYLSKAVNNFRRVQACEMTLQLLARKSDCKEENFKEMSGPLQQELIKVFQQACDIDFGMKAKHLHEIVKLADRFIKENKAKFKLPFDDQLKISISDAVDGPVIKRSPQLMAYCKRIIVLLSEQREPDTVIKNKKRKTMSASKKEGINGEHSVETEDEKKSASKCTENHTIKNKKKKTREK